MTTGDCAPLISITCVVFAALLFATATWHKARNFGQFKLLMAAYQILPEMFSGAMATLVVAAEGTVAVTLLFEQTRIIGALLGIACLVAYNLGIATNLVRGRSHIDCGCGVTRRAIRPSLLLRNVLLIVLLLPALSPTSPSTIEEMISASAAGMMIWATSLLLSQIWHNTDRVLQVKEETAR